LVFQIERQRYKIFLYAMLAKDIRLNQIGFGAISLFEVLERKNFYREDARTLKNLSFVSCKN
jgi:hypothetical protein